MRYDVTTASETGILKKFLSTESRRRIARGKNTKSERDLSVARP